MKKTISIAAICGLAAAGCATSSKDIASTYVSPMEYQNYDCEQLTSEMLRIQGRAKQLSGRLDEAADNDKAIAGVGIVLFWPALFALGGTKQQETEYARLQGEYEACQQSAILKKCPGVVGSPTQPTADTKAAPKLEASPSTPPKSAAADS